MRAILCDGCGDRIDDEWTQPMMEIKVHNGVDEDVAGDYCVDCAGDVAEAIRDDETVYNEENQ